MELLVALETLLLGLLSLLVVGLLRSHAEILHHLGMLDVANKQAEGVTPGLPRERAVQTPAHDVSGLALRGEHVHLAVASGGGRTLLAFLSSGCDTCHGFWDLFAGDDAPGLPAGVRLVVVTKDATHESPSKLRTMEPATIPVVMSSAAWEAYDIPGYPYFIYVEHGEVRGEGTARDWAGVVSLLQDALLEMHEAAVVSEGPAATQTSPRQPRFAREDAELRAAGLALDDISLYGGPPVGRKPSS